MRNLANQKRVQFVLPFVVPAFGMYCAIYSSIAKPVFPAKSAICSIH